jgi:hypothetical protein
MMKRLTKIWTSIKTKLMLTDDVDALSETPDVPPGAGLAVPDHTGKRNGRFGQGGCGPAGH